MPLTPEEMSARDAWFREHWSRHVPFNTDIGLDITDWEPGAVRARLKYQPRLSAHDGIFHGGVLATALDAVGGGAVAAGHDYNLGSRFTTVTMTVQYLSVAPGESEVLIEGVCTKRGRRLNFSRASVLTRDGRVLAEAVLTVSASGERPRVGNPEGA
ncbi:PaaI family thioesterase [Nocardia zapadnayensis]|uniref:PaaI family thioesterase n=1 Tax=Nocardia rhamnosiphila TaxID=426716 RepID=UPI002247D7A6|nr:PaaI family thioesterase [Nocardia zapadnayensis]MCX0272756.1 PaaI family thioesterase [Nocardia zapadnayensis]